MKDMSNPAWAAVFMFMACMMAESALFSHSSNATMVVTISSSIITGAFGFIQGVSVGKNSLQIPMNPDQPPSTISVTPPAAPAPLPVDPNAPKV